MTTRITARARLHIACALASALAVVIATACQQALSIDGEVVVAPHPVDACGMTLTTGACQECVASKCCTELQACGNNPGCDPYETCLLGCGTDYFCRSKCLVDHPINQGVEVPSLDTCVVDNCEKACGVGCGLAPSYVVGDAAAPCQDCVVQYSCVQAEACGKDRSCEIASRCGTACVTPDCRVGCALAATDAGFQEIDDFAKQVAAYCLQTCQVGSYWGCIGKIRWPIAKLPTTHVVLRVAEASNLGRYVHGALVKACPRDQTDCKNVVASGTTDANGQVTLDVPVDITGTGFQGYFDVTEASHVETLYFLGYPVSEEYAALNMILATPDDLAKSAAQVGVKLDPSRGSLLSVSYDCYLIFAHDVTIRIDEADEETHTAYSDLNGLVPSATATGLPGFAFSFNVPVTPVTTIHAIPNAVGTVSSSARLFVNPNMISVVDLFPTPNP